MGGFCGIRTEEHLFLKRCLRIFCPSKNGKCPSLFNDIFCCSALYGQISNRIHSLFAQDDSVDGSSQKGLKHSSMLNLRRQILSVKAIHTCFDLARIVFVPIYPTDFKRPALANGLKECCMPLGEIEPI